MSIHINSINPINIIDKITDRINDKIMNKVSWHLSEKSLPDSKNWRQLSLSNDILKLEPGNYCLFLTIDDVPQFAKIDFLIGSTNPNQKYYRFDPMLDGSFKSEVMHFTLPTVLKIYIYYKILKVPHIKSDQIHEINEVPKKIPHIASQLISGNLIIVT